MANFFSKLRTLFTPIHPLPAGNYHYKSPANDPRNYRLHLRLEEDGSGILIINAATILHLNHTAAEYAYNLVMNKSVNEAASQMAQRYHVDESQARKDYQSFIDRIQTLIETPDLDPVTFLDFERKIPLSGHITAPYRLDCAITYRLPESAAASAAPVDRVRQEMSTSEWKTILDKAKLAGIPHIVFTGGEPTLREDLPELIAYAEANDLVTGVLSDGMRFADAPYLDRLLNTGLDHTMILLQPDQDRAWEAIGKTIAADIFLAVHLTIDEQTAGKVSNLLHRLADLSVRAVSLSINNREHLTVLQSATQLAATLGMQLVWDLPVPYSANHPVALEVEEHERTQGAGRAWLYIEPDGDVLPAQGINRVLGNMLTDPWDKIWP